MDAEVWFTGIAAGTVDLDRGAERQALDSLRRLKLDEAFEDLLPYILDPYGPGTRRAVLRDPASMADRRARKDAGVFYTPSDVAEFMVRETLQAFSGGYLPTFVDPACGTGVFLRAAMHEMLARGASLPEIISNLYGLDVSVLAVDSCASVLMYDWIRAAPSSSLLPLDIWRFIRLNLAAVDSLTLGGDVISLTLPVDGVRKSMRREFREALLAGERIEVKYEQEARGATWGLELQHLFPEAGDGFDTLATNPPYARLGPRGDLAAIGQRFESLRGAGISPATNTFIPFVELMWKLVRAEGTASTIVPLSVAYSSAAALRGLRSAMEGAGGRWRFAFFDRTPDALFGDDVKQRTAILFRSGEGTYEVSVGPLQRWTSRTRHTLFQRVSFTELGPVRITSFIPKLSGRLEAEVCLTQRHTPAVN